MKPLAFVFALVFLGLSSCERHEWESKPGKPGTEELFPAHHADEGKEGDHAKKEGEHKEH
ncbi:MAG: hypothetical protein OSA93_00825 [Akkermansiaceae bacterium]|nr:hypothetical protein [Akkermansiaceae bacterium]